MESQRSSDADTRAKQGRFESIRVRERNAERPRWRHGQRPHCRLSNSLLKSAKQIMEDALAYVPTSKGQEVKSKKVTSPALTCNCHHAQPYPVYFIRTGMNLYPLPCSDNHPKLLTKESRATINRWPSIPGRHFKKLEERNVLLLAYNPDSDPP